MSLTQMAVVTAPCLDEHISQGRYCFDVYLAECSVPVVSGWGRAKCCCDGRHPRVRRWRFTSHVSSVPVELLRQAANGDRLYALTNARHGTARGKLSGAVQLRFVGMCSRKRDSTCIWRGMGWFLPDCAGWRPDDLTVVGIGGCQQQEISAH
jgi:hypothetical protein